jgi:succinoglycan biosynthesis protein ExoM
MLRRCLTAISKLVRPEGADLSIIVVDNEPEPNNRAIAEEFGAGYTHQPRRGIASARNAGVEAALALEPDWIAFVDDDTAPQPDWLISVLRVQSEHAADVVECRIVPRYPDPLPFWVHKAVLKPDEVPLCESFGLKSSAGTNGTLFSAHLVTVAWTSLSSGRASTSIS